MAVAGLMVAVASQAAMAVLQPIKVCLINSTKAEGYADDIGNDPVIPPPGNFWIMTSPLAPWAIVIFQKSTDGGLANDDLQIFALHLSPPNLMGPFYVTNHKSRPLNTNFPYYDTANGTDRLVIRFTATGPNRRVNIFLDHYMGAEPAMPGFGVPTCPSEPANDGSGGVAGCVVDPTQSDCDGNGCADSSDGTPTGATCGAHGCHEMTECESTIFTVLGKYKGDTTTCATQTNCDGVPAVSEWGLIALTMMMLVVGTIVLRRRVAVA